MRQDQRELQRTLYDRHYRGRVAAVREQLDHPLLRSFHDRLAARVFDGAVRPDVPSEHGRVVRLLELGCGEGLLGSALRRVAEERGLDLRYSGGDISEGALEIAREHLAGDLHRGDAIEVVTGIPSDSQDVVVVKNLLHHLDAPADFLREASRVAGADGRVVIVEPRLGCPHILLLTVVAPRREHYLFHGQGRNRNALRAAGLTLLRSDRFSWLPYEAAFVIRPGWFRHLLSTDDPGAIRRISDIDDRLAARLPRLATYVVWVAAPSGARRAEAPGSGTKRS